MHHDCSRPQTGVQIGDLPEALDLGPEDIFLLGQPLHDARGRVRGYALFNVRLPVLADAMLSQGLSAYIRSLPTSDPGDGLSMWNNAGVPTLASGVPRPDGGLTPEDVEKIVHKTALRATDTPPPGGGLVSRGGGVLGVEEGNDDAK